MIHVTLLSHEWLAAAYFATIAAAACVTRIGWRQRCAAVGVAVAVVGAIAALALAPQTRWVELLRAWVPGAYVLFGYWLPARLYVAPTRSVEEALRAADRRLEARLATERRIGRAPRLLLEYLELSYLLTYIFMPAGVVLVLLNDRSDLLGRFWTITVLGHLAAYVALLVIKTRPPWTIEPPGAIDRRPLLFRRVNLSILRHASNHLNTVPSGHASGTMAVALALYSLSPLWATVALVLALSIALAAYVGRYHYAIDVVSGMAVGLAAWVVVEWIGR